MLNGPPPACGTSVAVLRGDEIDQRLTRDDDPARPRGNGTVPRRERGSACRTAPGGAATSIDVDALLAAYFEQPPAAPVAFGTSGHRGTSLDGSFTEAHVVAISAAVCRYRDEQGTSGPLYLGRDTHALSAPAFRHDRRGARRRTASTSSSTRRRARRRRRSSRTRSSPTTAAAAARTTRPRTGSSSRRRTTRPATAASSTTRRTAGRPTPTSPAGSSARRTSCSRPGWTTSRACASAAPTRRDYVSAYVDDLGSVIDLDAIRGRRPAARRRPARRREPRLLAGDPRPPRARPRDRQRGARPDVPLRPARLGRQDPHGLLVAVRDGAAARHGRPLRRRVRQRPGRRPARDRHAVRRAAQPEPPPRGLRRLPVRRRARLGPGRRDRQDARLLLDHRPRRRGPRAPARRGAGRLQVVRPRADRRDDRLRRGGERRRVVPAPRRHRLEHRQGRADPVPARGGDEGDDGQGPGGALRRARRPLRRTRSTGAPTSPPRRSRRTCSSGSRPSRSRATSWRASRSPRC